ncbi:ferredoxin reductase, partial [Streptomyces sp. NPDC127079]|uniref:ferredoxin reductase n=1 Tax=Streptomyces sp. NPDC127079 TaxID=3347132 RepID=UPI00365EF287
MTTTWIDAVVTDRTMTTARVVVLDLEPIDGTPFPEHEAGAHIDVLLDRRGPEAALVRQYSLCGEPGNRKRYRIAVLRDERSRGGSVAMHGLEVGDHVRISAPRNVFRLVPARRHLLFAGGIGITPLLAMAQQLDADGGDYTLHYCVRSAADVALTEWFADHPRIVLHLDDQPAEQRLDLRRDLGDPVEDTGVFV